MSTWVGVDFDGTLCHRGQPVTKMVDRVIAYRRSGVEVRVLTARVATKNGPEYVRASAELIQAWCERHLGERLPVTSEKDYDMAVLYDDLAIAVDPETGDTRGFLTGFAAEVPATW